MSTLTPSQRAAQTHMHRRRRRLMAIGQWQPPYVDAEPVRAHVRALQEAGMSLPALSRRLNLIDGAFKNLLYGANGRPPGTTVSRQTAEAVLGYWPTLQDFPDTASIDPTGTKRRVQALETLGWSRPQIADEVGMSKSNFKTSLRAEKVSARLARRVAAVYDRLWTERPEDHGVQPYVAERVRRHAAQNGFAGPLAWDDDTIDDPKAEPQTDAAEPVATEGGNVASRWLMGESVDLGPEDRREVIQHLMEWTNDTPEEIAERLGMSVGAMWQTWTRIKKKARLEGRPVPWRRVYVPRDQDLKQNEMGEAA
jgi:hypothetical protein